MLPSISALLLGPSLFLAPDTDSDGDGLSDFLEVHKHLTDPGNADSDGDGVLDGDWLERREFAYTLRAVIQVMRPVTPEFLNDAYQDCRVLDVTETYVELEVILYPFVDLKGVGGDGVERDVSRWLEPGPTSNASPELGRAIRLAMTEGGDAPPDITTSAGVASAARWLLQRAKHRDRFTTFITGVDESGEFFIPEELKAYAQAKSRKEGIELEAAWPRELEAAGMFEHGERGSCTSSAIYLSGCLRALGVPTRTVLCVPVIDAGDESEWRLMNAGVQHNRVRTGIAAGLEGAQRSWSSHTFNEVYVEGRWRRLNYAEIDAGIFNDGYFGLMAHVATFHDWADARMWETVGLRSKFSNKEKRADIFGHHNPYSTIAIRDAFGVHCEVSNPNLEALVFEVEELFWTDSDALPEGIRKSNEERDRLGLIARGPAANMDSIVRHLREVNGEVQLSAGAGKGTTLRFHPGCVWLKSGQAFLYLPMAEAVWSALAPGETYRVVAPDAGGEAGWILDRTIRR